MLAHEGLNNLKLKLVSFEDAKKKKDQKEALARNERICAHSWETATERLVQVAAKDCKVPVGIPGKSA